MDIMWLLPFKYLYIYQEFVIDRNAFGYTILDTYKKEI